MSAVGVGLLWFSYWWGLSGYSMIRGWNNNVLGLANPVKLAEFTTQCYTGAGVFPTGDPADSGACGGGNQSARPVKPHKGKCPPGWGYSKSTGYCFAPVDKGGNQVPVLI